MSRPPDHLYELLPVVHRARDAERGYPLRALLRVINEQVNVVEDDIAQLYENWFIETCEDWVVPYIGDLIGYRPVHEAGDPGSAETAQGRSKNRILIPRREIANTLALSAAQGHAGAARSAGQRRGRLAGAGGRVLHAARLDAAHQSPAPRPRSHRRPARRRRARSGRRPIRLSRAHGRRAAHRVATAAEGRYNIPSVGVFVWRLAVLLRHARAGLLRRSRRPALLSRSARSATTTPLYTKPDPETEPTHIARGDQRAGADSPPRAGRARLRCGR